MAKIIKTGKLKVTTANYTCRTCDSVIEFDRSDVRSDQRDGDYVKCPLCNNYIDSSILHWETK